MAGPLYEINQPYRGERRKRDRFGALALVVIILLILGAVGWVLNDVLHLKTQVVKNSPGKTTHVTIAAPTTFKNSYFEFSDNAKWVYVPKNGNATKLVYMLYQSGVPAHSLTVYINQPPPSPIDIATTRVMPVQIKNGNSFVTGDISDACGKLYKPTDLKHDKLVSLSGTNMECVPDSPALTVMVGQIGGDYNLPLRRSDGSTAHYIILYDSLSINPNPAPFARIMKTFQAL